MLPAAQEQGTPSSLLRTAPDPFRSAVVELTTAAPARSRRPSLFWILPLMAAVILAIYLSAPAERQPTLYEVKPRVVSQADSSAPDARVSLEPEQTLSASELPAGLSDADKPRRRRQRATNVDIKVEGQGRSSASSNASATAMDEPDVGF
jgi:hypothetical protein